MNNYIHGFLQTDGDLFYIIPDFFIVKEDSLNEKQKNKEKSNRNWSCKQKLKIFYIPPSCL